MYSKKVMRLFKSPRNFGEMKNPDGVGKVGNKICGDVMHLYIKVKGKKIADISFLTFGCAAAIATSSMITELAKGKTLGQAMKITRNDVSGELGGLPPLKEHCSNLAADALGEAIYDYLVKHKKPVPDELKQRHESVGRHEHVHGEPA